MHSLCLMFFKCGSGLLVNRLPAAAAWDRVDEYAVKLPALQRMTICFDLPEVMMEFVKLVVPRLSLLRESGRLRYAVRHGLAVPKWVICTPESSLEGRRIMNCHLCGLHALTRIYAPRFRDFEGARTRRLTLVDSSFSYRYVFTIPLKIIRTRSWHCK